MPSISETSGTGFLSPLLERGYETLSKDQQIAFTLYNRVILPADGYVFWLNAGQTISVTGSLHYITDKRQDEDQTIGVNKVIFTTSKQVDELNSVGPDSMYVGSFRDLTFSFSRHGGYYEQADLWHYSGDAVYPALKAQLVQSPTELAGLSPVVSNSLPIWLSLNQCGSVYPSFLVPDNIEPPYVVVHIEPSGTSAIQAFPHMTLDNTTIAESSWSLWQLVKDRVRLTLYGFTNDTAARYLYQIFERSRNTDEFGLMSSPVVRDDKRPQAELSAIAQKKTIELTVSYYQAAALGVAKRLILQAGYNFPTP